MMVVMLCAVSTGNGVIPVVKKTMKVMMVMMKMMMAFTIAISRYHGYKFT